MNTPFNFTGQPPAVAGAARPVTLVEQSSFCLSDHAGDLHPEAPHGLFLLDTRVLSHWSLRVEGGPLEPLAVSEDTPFSVTFLTRQRTERIDEGLVVFRRRTLDRGLREDIELQNHHDHDVVTRVMLSIGADFASLFEVKEQRAHPTGSFRHEFDPTMFRFGCRRHDVERVVTVSFSETADPAPGVACWNAVVPAHGSWHLTLQVTLAVEGTAIEGIGAAHGRSAPAMDFVTWLQHTGVVDTEDEVIDRIITRSVADLGALRLEDPDHPGETTIAAGAPWFMTLFGRDSLITSMFTQLVDDTLAPGVLATLARLQGRRHTPIDEEEPGRILHELRFTRRAGNRLADAEPYYGSVDATPLFVIAVDRLWRHGAAPALIDGLLPHVDAALDWIVGPGDRTGSGLLSYRRTTPEGLQHQGWKDSFDAIRHADGSHPEGPIATCEAQAYAFGAFEARARLAADRGDEACARRWRTHADQLRQRFHEHFITSEGLIAVALDGEGRQVGSVTSNMGHCLWTGLADETVADAVAQRLLEPDMFSGWGIRTLSTAHPAYNPVSYHLGSVWPHDTAICVSGLFRYGHVESAHRVSRALFALAEAHGDEFPELIAGFSTTELSTPAAYPTSCLPQAWAAAAPFAVIEGLLGLRADVPAGRISLQPTLPEWLGAITVRDMPLGGARVTVRCDRSGSTIDGLPPSIALQPG